MSARSAVSRPELKDEEEFLGTTPARAASAISENAVTISAAMGAAPDSTGLWIVVLYGGAPILLSIHISRARLVDSAKEPRGLVVLISGGGIRPRVKKIASAADGPARRCRLAVEEAAASRHPPHDPLQE